MKITLLISIFFLLMVNPIRSSSVEVACSAIKKQDIKTLNALLKKVSFTQQEKRMLFVCANQAVRDYEATARFSSDTKQSMLATSWWLCAMLGGFCFSECVPYILLGMSDRREPISFSTFFAQQNSADKRYIVALLSATVASFGTSIASALECNSGYYTDKPRYIQRRISAFN